MNRIKKLLWLLIMSSILLPIEATNVIKTKVPVRPKGQKDVIELRVAPIKNVKVAVIGLGNRGVGVVYRLAKIPGCTITALCDVQQRYVDRAEKYLKDYKADTYTGAEDWKKICERKDIDLVYIATNWELHTPIAVYAMQHGKHAVIEVPAALTIDECWDLVDTAEKYQRHCMILENCNYDFFELSTLNMAQKGLFGEIVHCEGAYIHDLRSEIFDHNAYWNDWRLKQNKDHNGNLYPTHGLGPIAHVLSIHRGDRMKTLVSVSTNQFGLTAFAKEQFGSNSKEANVKYKRGDMNTTIIKTEKGKTMMIQHDITSPRPYSRHHLISGTKGFAQKWPVENMAFEPEAHEYMNQQKKDSLLKAYEHPIVKEVGEIAKKVGGHGGMDFIMDYRLIYCLNNGLPLDIDVYDAAEWSCLVPLTRLSIENENSPVEIPDFTRGAWNKLNKITYYFK